MGETLDSTISDLLERGLQLYGIGEARQAIEVWAQVLAVDPTNIRANEYIRFVSESLPDLELPLVTGVPAPVPLVEPAAVIAAPEPVAPAPEPVAPAPEPDAPAPEPVAPAPEPVAPLPETIEPAPEAVVDTTAAATEVPAAAVAAEAANPVDPSLAFSWGELVAVAVDAAPVPAPEPPLAAPAEPFDQSSTQPLAHAPALIATAEPVPEPPAIEPPPIETPAVEIDLVEQVEAPPPEQAVLASAPVPDPAVAVAPRGATDPLGDWGAAFDLEGATNDIRAAGELLTSPPAAPVLPVSGWDADPAATPPVALVSRGDGDDEYLVPITGENKLGRAERRPTQEQATAEPPPSTLDPRAAASECESLMQGARELFELGNFSESLELVEKVLSLDTDNREARDYLERNQETLLKMYESKIGSFQRTPRVLIPPDEVIWLNLHHRAGFLLSQIDGAMSYEDLLALSAMSKLETCKILVQLLNEGVITSS